MKKGKFFYGAVLDGRVPRMETYCAENIKELVKSNNLASYKEVSTPDRIMFNSEEKCGKFLDRFVNSLEELKLHPIGAMEGGSSLLCKRRYLALTLMGQKKSTTRTYNKKWIKGTIINLYDQTYFLKCKLIEIKDAGEGFFEYKYKMI